MDRKNKKARKKEVIDFRMSVLSLLLSQCPRLLGFKFMVNGGLIGHIAGHIAPD